MERISSISILDGGTELARTVSGRVRLRFGQVSGWVRDKGRQIRLLPGNDELTRALLSAERSPVEGARYPVGERINIYQPDGTCRRFRIYGLRSGGFSNAYTVIDLDEMRPYCLKESRALPGRETERNRMLAVEAEIALRLSECPNVVTTYAAVFFRSRLMILSEFISAASLDQRLKNEALSFEQALGYGLQLSSALRQSAEALPGFVHGDVKPGNCLITSDGRLKLGDFGLASADGIGIRPNGVAADMKFSRKETRATSGWGGTTSYMAPEMFDRQAPGRAKADIYAFGITLFELLTGHRPFFGDSKDRVIEMHRNAEPPIDKLRAKGVPRKVIEMIERCLAKSPADRPESFESVEAELRRTLQGKFEIAIPTKPTAELTDREIAARAYSLAALGDIDTAADHLGRAIDGRGRPPELLASSAITALLGSRTDDAYAASTTALMANARSFAVLLAHGRTLAARGNIDNAEQYFLRALHLEPDNCVTLNLLGELYLGAAQYDEAVKYFERSRKLDRSQVEPWQGIALANLFLGRIDRAIDLFRKALSLDPLSAACRAHLGDAQWKNGELTAAIRAYKASLALDAGNVQTAKKLVRACVALYRSNGRTVNRKLATLLVRGSRSAEPDSDRPTKFARELVSVLRENHSDPLLFFFLDQALAHAAHRMDADVCRDLVEALRTVRSSECPAYVVESIGRVFYYLEEYEDCQETFRAVLSRFGPNERAYYYLAACSEIGGRFRDSLSSYKAALRLEDCEDTRTGIARVTAKIREEQNRRRSSR